MCRGSLHFDQPDEFRDFTSGWLLDQKSLRGVHPGFPAALADQKSASISSIGNGPSE
jgi:UDP-N-acetylenolpyruvoylglucosamine reductase